MNEREFKDLSKPSIVVEKLKQHENLVGLDIKHLGEHRVGFELYDAYQVGDEVWGLSNDGNVAQYKPLGRI